MKIIKESILCEEDTHSVSSFIGKPLKNFLRTIDGRTKLNIESENGFNPGFDTGMKLAGSTGQAQDVGWYMADVLIKSIEIPEDTRFYKYKILTESCNFEEEISSKEELDEEVTSDDLYQKMIPYIEDIIWAALDNIAIVAASDISEYDPDWADDSSMSVYMQQVNKAVTDLAEKVAQDLLVNAPEVIEENLTEEAPDYSVDDYIDNIELEIEDLSDELYSLDLEDSRRLEIKDRFEELEKALWKVEKMNSSDEQFNRAQDIIDRIPKVEYQDPDAYNPEEWMKEYTRTHEKNFF